MERNVDYVKKSKDLKHGACELLKRSIELAQFLMTRKGPERLERGGRKGHHLKILHSPEAG